MEMNNGKREQRDKRSRSEDPHFKADMDLTGSYLGIHTAKRPIQFVSITTLTNSRVSETRRQGMKP